MIKRREFLLMFLPALVVIGIFFLGPALWAVYISFTDYALLGPSARNPRFIGLGNYIRMLGDPLFLQALYNSIVFVVGSAYLGQFLIGLGIALLLHYSNKWGVRGGTLVYSTVLVGWIVPALLAGFIWVAMYDYYYGTLNTILRAVGLPPVSWLSRDLAMLSVIVANIWRGTAFTMILFLAGLETVPQEVYDAARIDGASGLQTLRYITLPMLKEIAVVDLLSITMSTFGVFIIILTLTNGGPGFATEVLALYAYHRAFQNYEIGYGSAISVFLILLNVAIGVVYIKLSRRGEEVE